MLELLVEPFQSSIVRHALSAGVIVAMTCAIVGTWVVLRGSAFLGEAMGHGLLPGVAVASAIGGNVALGGLLAALAMAYGVTTLGSSARLSADTSIGLLLVGMLALGVIIVSHSGSYATDLTSFLFGDVLAATRGDIIGLGGALAVVAAVAVLGRRAFLAATLDVRKAATLGLRPKLAAAALTVLMAVSIVASFQVVGTLLVLGLLVAPPAAASVWARSVTQIMVGAAALGILAVVTGLAVSWHAGTAGGATIAATAVALFFCSLAGKVVATRVRAGAVAAASVGLALGLVGCSAAAPPTSSSPPSPTATAQEGAEHNLDSPEVEELADPLTRLVVVDSASGATEVFDALDESGTAVGEFGPVQDIGGDGRFAYLFGANDVTVVDSGAWTFDHGDHNHYYAKPPSVPGSLDAGARTVSASNSLVALSGADGRVSLLDRGALGKGAVSAPDPNRIDVAEARVAAPLGDVLVVATATGDLRATAEDGTVVALSERCDEASSAVRTRSALVLTCRDGAVRVSGRAEVPEASAIPYPAGVPPELTQLKNRGQEGILVGLADEQVWVLDSSARTWTSMAAPGAVAANAGADGTVLVLSADGVLRLLDMRGSQVAELPLFDAAVPGDAPAPVIEVDRDRAYINDAAAQSIYEIDYRDGLRLARTLRTGVTPDLMVETGR